MNDPRASAIVGAAFACLTAARAASRAPGQFRPFEDLPDEMMSTFSLT